MSRKKRLIKRTRRTKTYDTETGPVTEMEGITVTPEGNSIGLPADTSELIPEGAELTDEQRRKLEARRGAIAVNSGRAQVAPYFAQAAAIPAYLSPFGALLGTVEGSVGLYNQYQNGDFQRMADVATSDTSLWNKTKQIAPIALETGLNAAMVAPGVAAARQGALYTIGRYGSGAMQNSARAALVSDAMKLEKIPVVTEPVAVEKPLYEPATKVVKSEPYAKVWRNGQGYNSATAYQLDTKPSYFEIVNDKEPGYHSVHFKTEDPRLGIDGRSVTTPQERQMLFDAVTEGFPEGELLSTHGNLTPGEVRGLNKFQTQYDWIKVGDRNIKTNVGEDLTIPVLQKPYKPTIAPEDLAGNTRVRRAKLIRKAEDAPEVGREAPKINYEGNQPLESLGVKYGTIGPDDITVPDNYVPSSSAEDFFGPNAIYFDTEAEYVWDNYRKAMTRRRSYLNRYPFYAVSSGSGNGVRLNNSVILGHTNVTPNGTEYFMPSHFAPASLREGYELIDRLGKSDQPVAFAITDDLQKMLQKTGNWYYAGSVPQIFDGQIVMKKLMVNKAFKPEIIEEIAKEYHLDPEVFKKQLLESRGMQQELSPTMTPLSELLTEEDLLKLKNSIK